MRHSKWPPKSKMTAIFGGKLVQIITYHIIVNIAPNSYHIHAHKVLL